MKQVCAICGHIHSGESHHIEPLALGAKKTDTLSSSDKGPNGSGGKKKKPDEDEQAANLGPEGEIANNLISGQAANIPKIPIKKACCPNCSQAVESEPSQPAFMEESEAKGPSIFRLIIASVLGVGCELLSLNEASKLLVIAVAVAAVALGGIDGWLLGWQNLIKDKKLDIASLMAVAVTGAVLIGDYAEGALVLVLFTLAERLEDRSVAKAGRAISELLKMAPEMANVKNDDGSFALKPSQSVPVGAIVRVKPGEKLSLDGRVVKGFSAIDQAPITGESTPVDKGPGGEVFAGTLNISGVIDYEVTKAYGDSALARIVKSVKEARLAKAPVERFVERFAKYYTPAVFVLAILAAVLPPLLFNHPWRDWIYRALALLVISCPCALVISTPVAIVSAMAAATKKGMLVKGGAYLELGRRLITIAMDKTGTITKGRPERTDFLPQPGFAPTQIDRLSASLAALSSHPISTAIARASNFQGAELISLEDFTDLPGQGLSAVYEGHKLILGNLALMKANGLDNPQAEQIFENLSLEGKSVVGFMDNGRLSLIVATADAIKKDSLIAIKELNELGLNTVMLTGDNDSSALNACRLTGITDYKSSLMPEDKLKAIKELSAFGPVGMVGDGVNDAPALAQADVGFSMGAAGTGAAIETAQVAIMDDSLSKIPIFIKISRKIHSILWQNIIFILLIKASFIAATLLGRTAMWMAVLADIGVCLIVISNSLRLSDQK
ncbi:MAG: heavy metal translocating P-type ATPase [Deltaproteobacteria bacterium]|jgi:Cd2+/Zn2+-exporting ATPase|nr:heavy metal translocating P-type ATPase [Deltaproteobacteria bacterium]